MSMDFNGLPNLGNLNLNEVAGLVPLKAPAAKPEVIQEFRGEYDWLSNFYVHPAWDGYTVEHLFQSAKAATVEQASWVLEAPSPGEAKRRGRAVTLREGWEEAKDIVMMDWLKAKFKIPELREKLLATGDKVLIEGNTWGDTYWGVDLRTGEGSNRLGVLLMELRRQLREQDGRRANGNVES